VFVSNGWFSSYKTQLPDGSRILMLKVTLSLSGAFELGEVKRRPSRVKDCGASLSAKASDE
jgi:hypothetical protein